MKIQKIDTNRLVFIQAAKNVEKAFYQLLTAWEEISLEDNSKSCEGNPFPLSFDEFVYQYGTWLSNFMEYLLSDETQENK